jgi:hypothetical protein
MRTTRDLVHRDVTSGDVSSTGRGLGSAMAGRGLPTSFQFRRPNDFVAVGLPFWDRRGHVAAFATNPTSKDGSTNVHFQFGERNFFKIYRDA